MQDVIDYAGGPPPLPFTVRALPVERPFRVSGTGVASCVLGAVAIGLVATSGVVMLVGRAGSGGGPPTSGDFFAGLAMLASGCGGGLLAVIGLVLGAVGAASRDCRTAPAHVGLVVNGLAVLSLFGLATL